MDKGSYRARPLNVVDCRDLVRGSNVNAPKSAFPHKPVGTVLRRPNRTWGCIRAITIIASHPPRLRTVSQSIRARAMITSIPLAYAFPEHPCQKKMNIHPLAYAFSENPCQNHNPPVWVLFPGACLPEP